MVDFGIDDDEVVFSQGDLGFIGAQPSFAVGYVEEFGAVVGVEDTVPVGAEGGGGYVAEVLVGGWCSGISLLRNRIGWTCESLLVG